MEKKNKRFSCVLVDSASDYFGLGKCFPGGTTPPTKEQNHVWGIFCACTWSTLIKQYVSQLDYTTKNNRYSRPFTARQPEHERTSVVVGTFTMDVLVVNTQKFYVYGSLTT